ncbi:MAG: DUF554 domain-containing protein [Anaerovoracaceae bacterium]
MLGLVVNTLAIVVGGVIGLLAKKGVPDTWNDQIMKALGFGVLFIGITGLGKGGNPMIVIISMVIGTIIGIVLKLDHRVNNIGIILENKFAKGEEHGKFSEGFVTASILFCAGAMAIIASLEAGLNGNNEMLFTKSIMDFVPSVLLASTLGAGVIFAAAMVFVYQGFFILTAGFFAPYLSTAVTNEISVLGSLLLVAMCFNVIGLGKFKIMNMVPAVFMPIVLVPLFDWIGSVNL